MKLSLLVAFFALSALPTAAQDNNWVTFKTIRDKWGKTEHQIDRTTIRQEGPYRVFWTRAWLPATKQPLFFSANQKLVMISQKYAVDCGKRRFASHYIDSSVPKERKKNADLRTVQWDSLEKTGAIARTVCGEK